MTIDSTNLDIHSLNGFKDFISYFKEPRRSSNRLEKASNGNMDHANRHYAQINMCSIIASKP